MSCPVFPPPHPSSLRCAAQSPNGIVCFHPPVAVVYEYSLGFMGPYSMQNDLLAVPSAPGKALVFTLGTSNTPTVSNGDLVKTALTNPMMLPTMLLRWGKNDTLWHLTVLLIVLFRGIAYCTISQAASNACTVWSVAGIHLDHADFHLHLSLVVQYCTPPYCTTLHSHHLCNVSACCCA